MKELKKIGVLSTGKIMAIIGLIFGFLYALLIYIVQLVVPASALTSASGSTYQPFSAIILLEGPGIGLVVYCLIGMFVAVIYNLLAKLMGGIKIDLVEHEHGKKN